MRQSSAGTAIRAMVMLACVVGIPAAALSGTSWSELVKKFQSFHFPDILPVASASTSPTEAEQATPEEPAARPAPAAEAPRRAAEQPAAEGDPSLTADPEIRRIQGRLRQLGATYYVLELLEAWNQQPQSYRFYCKVAVDRGFEATAAEPLPAMAEVLRQVEEWRGQ